MADYPVAERVSDVVYFMLAIWLVLSVLLGRGVYQLLTGLAKPSWTNVALLPGTAVSELSYVLGCLVSGGEVRKAKLLDSSAGKATGGTQATGSKRLPWLSPLVASLVSLAACTCCIVVVHSLLGGPVIRQFAVPTALVLPQAPPASWAGFWSALHGQLDLLRRFSETLVDLRWLDWRVPLFVYLVACLSVRLAPAGRPLRPIMLATAILAVAVSLAGLVSKGFGNLVADVWPLLTYVWVSLLWMMGMLLIVKAVLGLVKAAKA